MNPKGVNDLDPKLKEAYDRIMGTSDKPKTGQAPTIVSPPTGQPQAAAAQPPVMQTQTVDPCPAGQSPLGGAFAASAMTQLQPLPQVDKNAFSQSPDLPVDVFGQNGPSSQTQGQKKKLNVLSILVFLGGVVFFVVYGAVWAKVFGLF